ncbi:MAG: serine/threonine-protein kinase [Pirellulaceae bacterium]
MDKSKLGPFVLEDRLGDPRTSSVFRALHLQQRKMVALKVFSAPLVANSPAAKAALVREIDTLKKLIHPNITRCYGGLLEASHGCIAWELVDAESLSHLLARRERLSWETVVEYAAQISAALEYAHSAGVVHQDLTPEKVLVTTADEVKIIDFRVDRAANPTCASSQRRTLYRARYQAPEQLRGESKLTHKVDLYALGCMLFEMLVGRPPFEADRLDELVRLHLEQKAPRVDALVLDCPVWLDSLIGQLLDKDPVRRPYSAAAVTTALAETHRKIAAGTSVLEHAAGGFSALQRTADQNVARDLLRKARREAIDKQKADVEKPAFWEQPWFLAVCLLILASGVGGWLFWPRSEAWYFAHAQELMATDDEYAWEQARDRYLLPLLERFPEGEHRDAAEAYLDQIAMGNAESGLRRRTRLGLEPKSEAERLYAEAWTFDQFGDRIAALERYEAMINLLDDKGPDRPFVNLARRQKAAIEKEGKSKESVDFIQERLQHADELARQGETIEARKIWTGIVNLYERKREYAAFVQQAQDRIEGKPRPPAGKPPAGSAS